MLIVTVDLDWAPEPAIEETLSYLLKEGVIPTVFITHRSSCIEDHFREIEVGLHPFFHPDSSHGKTLEEVVESVMSLPHNVPAFRSHRYGQCNESNRLMVEAGMKISSNVCTDLECIQPFIDRLGLIQVPIYFEDGSYLWNRHPLEMEFQLFEKNFTVMNIHPMHFAINTPTFDYMAQIKRRFTRKEWIGMDRKALNAIKYQGEGIRQVTTRLLNTFQEKGPLVRSIAKSPRFSTKIAKGNESIAMH